MNQFTCPICRQRLTVQPVGRSPTQYGFKRQDWQDFAFEVGGGGAAALPAGATFTRRQPARPASVESDVKVPFFQAMICGAIGGLVTLMVVIAVAVKERWALWVPPVSALSAFLLVGTITWFLLLGAHRKLLWLVEEITGQDLNKDGEVGDPDEVHIWLGDAEEKSKKKTVLPVNKQTLRRVAKAVLQAGKPFSRRGLKGILSDGKFRKLEETLLQEGWAVYKEGGPNAGIELTYPGAAALRWFLEN